MKKPLFSTLVFILFLQFSVAQTVSGYVTRSEDGEPLIGCNIYNLETLEGTTSNLYGFYSFTLPVGEVKLSFSYVGLERKQISLDVKNDTTLNNALNSINQLEEVEIVANRKERIEDHSQMSSIDVPLDKIKTMPVLLGEQDVLKTIQLLPGVQSGSEGSSGIYESTQTPKIGKVYTLRVASDGLDSVRAESEILSPVQIKRISKAQKRYESLDYTELSIVFSDDEKVANYYNVSLYEYEGETFGNCEFFGTPFYFASVDNELKIGDILDTNSVEYFDQDGAAFNDLLFNGTNYTLKLLIENRHIDSIDVAMVEIKSLSKNYYEYITTRTAYILAQGDPFSQPVYVKSNIENGYGIFAGYSNTWDCIPLK